MAKQRRKRKSVLGTLIFEITTLAGILGIAQPTLRENVWWALTAVRTFHDLTSDLTPSSSSCAAKASMSMPAMAPVRIPPRSPNY